MRVLSGWRSRFHGAAPLMVVGLGMSTAAAHLGNNFTTFLIGGLIDRFGFTPIQMGAWSMAETLATGVAAQLLGGYRTVGPIGMLICLGAIAVIWPLVGRSDRDD